MREMWYVVELVGDVELVMHSTCNESSARDFFAKCRPRAGAEIVLRVQESVPWRDVERKASTRDVAGPVRPGGSPS